MAAKKLMFGSNEILVAFAKNKMYIGYCISKEKRGSTVLFIKSGNLIMFSRRVNNFEQGNAQRPEVRVVTWNNDELSTDALPVHGFEHYKAKDYSLAHAPFSG